MSKRSVNFLIGALFFLCGLAMLLAIAANLTEKLP
jgi:hypothetical protein